MCSIVLKKPNTCLFKIKENGLLEKQLNLGQGEQHHRKIDQWYKIGFWRKILKTEYCNGKDNTHFFDIKVPKENNNCVCVVVIVLDLVCKIKRKIITHKYS